MKFKTSSINKNIKIYIVVLFIQINVSSKC